MQEVFLFFEGKKYLLLHPLMWSECLSLILYFVCCSFNCFKCIYHFVFEMLLFHCVLYVSVRISTTQNPFICSGNTLATYAFSSKSFVCWYLRLYLYLIFFCFHGLFQLYLLCFLRLISFSSGVSNSKCSEGQMRTESRIMTTRGPHYDADATMVVLEPQ